MWLQVAKLLLLKALATILSISKSSLSQVAILIFFWQKREKPSPTVPHPKLPFMPSSEKEPSRAYICALVSAAHPSVSEEVEGHKNNFISVLGS